VLPGWGIELVDTPATDRGQDDALDVEFGSRDAVLYVIPSRGAAERDGLVLERLRQRRVPVVVVANLRDAEISASTAAFGPLDVGHSAVGSAIPVALSRVGPPGIERNAMMLAVGLLHAEILREEHSLLGPRADQRLRQLRAAYAGRLAAVRGPLASAHPLRGAAELLRIERDGLALGRAEGSLASVIAGISAVPAIEEFRALVGAEGERLADEYNIEAGGRVRASSRRSMRESAADQRLGQAMGRMRDALRGFIAGLRADGELRLTREDRIRLGDIGEQVKADRLELVFIGQFSAGKSTLINALLGTELLPAKRSPTTATINEVSHSEGSTVAVDWITGSTLPLELTLLEATAGRSGRSSRIMDRDLEAGEYRVHDEEIRALAAWLRDGTVLSKHCHFRHDARRGEGRAGDEHGTGAFQRLYQDLWDSRLPNGKLRPYAYTTGQYPALSADEFPVAATINSFAKKPPELPSAIGIAGVTAVLDMLGEDPAVTLRVDKVRIGHRHELLRHLTVVDTPGTDAPIPRHRLATEAVIKEDRLRAVVYCFNGLQPAGTEDDRNLELIRSCRTGPGELSRFFFVITQRGVVNPDGDPRVDDQMRGRVLSQLRRQGIAQDRVHFTEVVRELNEDFMALAEALSAFGVASKGPRLKAWAQEIMTLVGTVRDREKSVLEQLSQDEEQRRAKVVALRRELTALEALTKELTTDQASWGIPWARNRAAPGGLSAATDLAVDIGSLSMRDDFSGFADRADDALAALNRQALSRAESAWQTTRSRLQTRLATDVARGRTITPPEITIPGEVFPSASVLQAARDCHWRSGWQRFTGWLGGTAWKQDVTANRERIEEAWQASQKSAATVVADAISAAAEGALAELRRVAAGINAEISSLSAPPSEAERQAARAGLARCADWLTRLGSLTRTMEEDIRGVS
jgi:hypothetical protein